MGLWLVTPNLLKVCAATAVVAPMPAPVSAGRLQCAPATKARSVTNQFEMDSDEDGVGSGYV